MTLFPERLKTLREKENLLQRELAEKLNLSRVTVTQYEQGKRTPDWDTLQKIADFFEVSTDYLLGRTDDPTPSSNNQNNIISILLLYIFMLQQSNSVKSNISNCSKRIRGKRREELCISQFMYSLPKSVKS